ncbi:MAG TPA: hypothetical protein VFU02_18110 [Polyangiaceae bacterium]|nr:hypothetical protein [Polyangiaceae bacterium]
MMERTAGTLTLALALLGFACLLGCEATQPKQVDNPDPLGLGADDVVAEGETPGEASGEEPGESEPPENDDAPPAEPVDGKPLGGEPEFTENMSVSEAIKAVPPNADRLEIEEDRLAEPLADSELYEPCKLGNGHFKARVAVWNGRAVGVDIETSPKNPQLARCIDQQIRELKWADKVRSLNTVEYSY